MEEEKDKVGKTRTIAETRTFLNVRERAEYLMSQPGQFPELVEKFFFNVPDHRLKEGVPFFVHNLMKDPDTRHDAHWAFQTYLLWEIWSLMKEGIELLKEMNVLKGSVEEIRRRKTTK